MLNELLKNSLDQPLDASNLTVPLIEHGLDSLTFIRFILLLEEELDIEILDSDLMIEKFATLELILQTLDKYEITE